MAAMGDAVAVPVSRLLEAEIGATGQVDDAVRKDLIGILYNDHLGRA